MATKAKKQRQKTPVERAASAVGSRIRIEALTIFNERVASVKEVAQEIDEDLSLVGYHVKQLLLDETLEPVTTELRGGAVEHFYRAVRRPELSDEEWHALDEKDREEISAVGFRNLFAEGLASVQAGKAGSDPHLCIWWKASQLDSQGREEAAREQAKHIERLQDIEAKSLERMVKSGEDKVVASTVLAALGFTRSRSGQPAIKPPLPSDD